MSDTVYVGYSCRPCITLHHLIIIMTGISCHTHNIQQYCSSLTHKTSQNSSTCIMSNFCCIGYEISFVVGVMNTKGSKRYSCISNFFSTCMCNLGFNSIQKISAVPWAFIYLASSHAKLFFYGAVAMSLLTTSNIKFNFQSLLTSRAEAFIQVNLFQWFWSDFLLVWVLYFYLSLGTYGYFSGFRRYKPVLDH